VMTARRFCRRLISPNRATRFSFLPSRVSLASKQVLGPSPVMILALCLAAMLRIGDITKIVDNPARKAATAAVREAEKALAGAERELAGLLADPAINPDTGELLPATA
jgi:hypothetical protein